MNIKQALKEKNKLVTQINDLYKIAKEYNSIEIDNTRRFDIEETLQEADFLTKQLIEIKAKIHKANNPVYDKIFEISELKSRIKELKLIPTIEGKFVGRYGTVPENRQVQIDAKSMSKMIKEIEKRIDIIQEELDVHNAITQI